MVEKLQLPFPLLSDPDGSGAIKAYEAWHEEADLAKPATVVIGPDGEEAYRQVGHDYADRITEDELAEVVEGLGLDAAEQERPAPGEADPSENAMQLAMLGPYFLGNKFAAKAIGIRSPESREHTKRLEAEADRYSEALQAIG